MKDVIKIGQLVCSTLGRDKGRVYLVIGILDSNRLLVADGKYRKIEKPKKKNIKHVSKLPLFVAEVAELVKEKRLSNGTVNKIISDYQQSGKCLMGDSEEVIMVNVKE